MISVLYRRISRDRRIFSIRTFCEQGPSTEEIIRYRIAKFRRTVYPVLVGGLLALAGTTYYLQRDEKLRHLITEYPGIFSPFVELLDVMRISPDNTSPEVTNNAATPKPVSLLPSLDQPSTLPDNAGRDILMEFFKQAAIPLTCVQVALLAIVGSNNVGATMFPVLKRYKPQILIGGIGVIIVGGYFVAEAALDMKRKGDALKAERLEKNSKSNRGSESSS